MALRAVDNMLMMMTMMMIMTTVMAYLILKLDGKLDGIMKYDLKEICQVPEHATSLANLFVMATQLSRIFNF